MRAATGDRIDVVVSADLGPDLLAPWRAPTLTVLYTSQDLDLEPVGFVKAMARGEASLITRYVSDRSLLEVWPEPNRRDLPLAHPLQQFWDLYDLGGSDRREAADRLISRVYDDDSVGAMG